MASRDLPKLFTIVVAGGTGSLVVTGVGGDIQGIGILAPSGVATWSIEITDIDGFGIFGNAGNTGNITFNTDFQWHGQQTITISVATDGTYKVKLWFYEH